MVSGFRSSDDPSDSTLLCPRRHTLAACLAAITAFPLSAAVDTGQMRSLEYLMGTSVRIEIYGGDAALRQQAADEAFAAVAEVDSLMSDYRADSEVTRVNQAAADSPVVVSAPLMAVLSAGERVSRESQGAFDVTLRPALMLWGFKNHAPHIPTSQEIGEVQPLIGTVTWCSIRRHSRSISLMAGWRSISKASRRDLPPNSQPRVFDDATCRA